MQVPTAVVLFTLLAAFFLADGINADFGRSLSRLPSASSQRARAVQWLLHQRKADYGWGTETARVVTTLQLADDAWLYEPTPATTTGTTSGSGASNNVDLSSLLSVKQLELELLLTLWSRKQDNPLRAGRVAQFVNSLVSTCRDPRAFHGHDLVSVLDHLEASHPFEFSYVTLALCNAGVHVRKKQVRRLLSIVEATDTPHNHDTMAILVQALTCITGEHHNRNLISVMHRPIKKLKKAQKEDGSFGNIHTSAIVTQALIPTPDEDGSWNATRALQFLLSQQQEDGSFGNLLATTSVLPILAGRSYVQVRNTTCHRHNHNNNNQESTSVLPVTGDDTQLATPEPHPFSVNYSIWVGNNATDNFTLTLTMPHNVSFFEIMKQAAEVDERYEFAASLWPNGHYVHTLSSLKENTTMNHYWLLGVLSPGADRPTFVDVGVDEFYPRDGDHIVFWYKQI